MIHFQRFLVAISGFLLCGCANSHDAVSSAATATTLSPVVSSYAVGYGVAFGANDLGQNSTMIVGAAPDTFSTEIDRQRLEQLAGGYDASGFWVRPEWKYMGTKNGFHYFACYPPFLGMREIYRVPVSQLSIEKPFDLRTTGIGWRDYDVFPSITNGGNGRVEFNFLTNAVMLNYPYFTSVVCSTNMLLLGLPPNWLDGLPVAATNSP